LATGYGPSILGICRNIVYVDFSTANFSWLS